MLYYLEVLLIVHGTGLSALVVLLMWAFEPKVCGVVGILRIVIYLFLLLLMMMIVRFLVSIEHLTRVTTVCGYVAGSWPKLFFEYLPINRNWTLFVFLIYI